MSGPDWIQTSDLQWLHQFREHFPVYSAPTPQMNKFRDIFRSLRYSIPTSYNGWFRSTVLLAISPDALPLRHVAHMVSIVHCKA